MQLEYSALPLMTKLPLEKVKSAQPSGAGWILFGDENYPKWAQSNDNKMTFVLGTDRYGRDLLSRLLLGARVSLSVGIISVLIALLIGIPIGSLAGYYGGWIDKVVQTIIQIFWSIPTFLMVIAISFVLGKGFWQVFVAVGLTAWVEIARLVRGQVMSVKKEEFVQAGQVLGFSSLRIIVRHILPQVYPAIIVLAASQFASAILLESGLSFLGIGAQPPMPTWGSMIRDHYSYLLTGQAHLALIPGIAIASLVLAFMSIGTALRDVLDVRTLD
jgi:peptide/nickel transport system permease protein